MAQLGWHFVHESKRLGYGDGRIVRAGRTYKVKCEPVLCASGLHASQRIIDALEYAAGPVICRVRVGGQIVHGADKFVGTERKVLWMFDATSVLHEFACRVAERALKTAKVEDARCWAAINVKREWLAGEATDEELAAARDAAWDAARDAAWAAARVAACDAAESAAGDAARTAARDAAWAAERAAAGNAAWAARNRTLTSLVNAEAKRKGLRDG